MPVRSRIANVVFDAVLILRVRHGHVERSPRPFPMMIGFRALTTPRSLLALYALYPFVVSVLTTRS